MRFSKILYVKMEQDGDIVYPVPSANLADLVSVGETQKIGIYRLTETTYAIGEVKTSQRIKTK